jgi:hypothetical protein
MSNDGTPQWKKSSYSPPQGNDSIEVAWDPESDDGVILIRESDPSFGGGIVRTDRKKLAAFVKGVKAGEFDTYA